MGERGRPRARSQEGRGLTAEDAFRATYEGSPDGVWCAPGRVNLIGEHTDYNDGFVLPLAVDLLCRVAARARPDRVLRLVSSQLGDGGTCRLDDRRTDGLEGWAAYVAGVAWALEDAGVEVCGADLLVDSAVPAGAGLSSSAALECSAGLALAELAGSAPEPDVLALAGQRAEAQTVGAPVGVMDQMASAHGSRRGALLLDCRSLSRRSVRLPLEDHGLVVLAIDTRVAHAHAHGGYAQRRAECEQAAQQLGLSSLRDASEADLTRLDGVLLKRARHVVTENARVLAAANALESGALDLTGALFAASHASLRDDFEVSCVELDLAVEAAAGAGAVAARMTGGGFGGSVVALVPAGRVGEVEQACTEAASGAGAPLPLVRVVGTASGACRCG